MLDGDMIVGGVSVVLVCERVSPTNTHTLLEWLHPDVEAAIRRSTLVLPTCELKYCTSH